MSAAATAPPQSAGPTATGEAEPTKIPLFGARAKARELDEQARELGAEVARLKAVEADNETLRAELSRLGALEVVELERQRASLQAQIAREAEQFERDRAEALAAHETETAQAAAELDELRKQVVATADEAVLQEVGVYEYRHPLSDAVAYKAELSRVKDSIKAMTRKDGGAVSATTDWNVNGSAAQGRKMVRDFSKLMLRAYNAEADNLVRAMKPYKVGTAIERLTKVTTTIERLGVTMDIRISHGYHQLRIREMELTADYLEKVAEEKEREREEKARLREEQKVQQEMAREREKLEKERQHHLNALAALAAKGDTEGEERIKDQIADIEQKIENVDYRAANVRAGYVYVISNVGAFGDSIVKVGMTRRLEPKDRVRELGDASVPFKFDTHALFFSNDAVGIETELHRRLAERRVNRVNLRREFFRATPAEVREHLIELHGELLEFSELPEAVEFHQSQAPPGAVGGEVPA